MPRPVHVLVLQTTLSVHVPTHLGCALIFIIYTYAWPLFRINNENFDIFGGFQSIFGCVIFFGVDKFGGHRFFVGHIYVLLKKIIFI